MELDRILDLGIAEPLCELTSRLQFTESAEASQHHIQKYTFHHQPTPNTGVSSMKMQNPQQIIRIPVMLYLLAKAQISLEKCPVFDLKSLKVLSRGSVLSVCQMYKTGCKNRPHIS